MLPAHHPSDGRLAVILNANAGRVTRALARRVRRAVGEEHVFLTTSPEHADEALRTCIERDYTAVFAGGGDGTIVDTINGLERYRGGADRLPAVGVLRLGTGNALAHWLGAGWPVWDLRRYARGDLHTRRRIRMVESEGTLFPFGGVGHDAAILNHYYEWKNRFADTPFAKLFSGLTGYLLAGFGRTLPTYLTRPNAQMRVVNTGAPARRIRPGGDPFGPTVPTGGTLYEGPACFVGAATTPLLGYGMKFFPYSTLHPDRMHVRLLDFTPIQCATNLPAGWRGTLSGEGVFDWYAERIRVQFDQALPYQMGGDPKGYRTEVTFGMSEHPVTLIGQA